MKNKNKKNKKNRKSFWIGMALGSVPLISAGTAATVIILPKVNTLKEGLGSLVFNSDAVPYQDNIVWRENKPIKYLAIGDSISAGFNGALGMRDSISFPDLLAKTLRNSDKLASYKNISKSALTIWGGYEMLANNLKNLYGVKEKADLITISIGGNDLLAALNVLNFTVPYNEVDFPIKIDNLEKIYDNMFNLKKDHNVERKKLNINKGLKTTFEEMNPKITEPHQILNNEEINSVFSSSAKKFRDMYKNKDWSALLEVNENWLSSKGTIFDFIKKNLMSLLNDLHKINPMAKIFFIVPKNPFGWFPDKMKNDINPKTNMSIQQIYNNTYNAMKEACEFNMKGKNNVVEFIDSSKLFGKKNVRNIKDMKSDDGKDYIVKNAFNNILDIHPSIYGNKLIADGIFKKIAPRLGVENPEQFFVKTEPYDSGNPLARIDEDPKHIKLKTQKAFYNFLHKNTNFVADFLDSIKDLPQIPDAYKINIENLYQDYKPLKYEDYYDLNDIWANELMVKWVVNLFKQKPEIKKLVLKHSNFSISNLTSMSSDTAPIFENLNSFLSAQEKNELKEFIIEKMNSFHNKTKERSERPAKTLLMMFHTMLNLNITNIISLKSFAFPEQEILKSFVEWTASTTTQWISSGENYESLTFNELMEIFKK